MKLLPLKMSDLSQCPGLSAHSALPHNHVLQRASHASFPLCWMQKHFHAATVFVYGPLNPPGSQGAQECTQLLALGCHHRPLWPGKPQPYSWQVSPPCAAEKGSTEARGMQTISQTNLLFTKSPVNCLHCWGERMEEQQLERALPSGKKSTPVCSTAGGGSGADAHLERVQRHE